MSRGEPQDLRRRPVVQSNGSEHRVDRSIGTLHPAQNPLSRRCRSRASLLQENGPARVCTSPAMRKRPRNHGHGVPKVADRWYAKSSELLSPFWGVERNLGWAAGARTLPRQLCTRTRQGLFRPRLRANGSCWPQSSAVICQRRTTCVQNAERQRVQPRL